ncbi:MAG: hypothetical protein ACRENS_00175 [Candidatus Eiseniibacteriota bacterium]
MRQGWKCMAVPVLIGSCAFAPLSVAAAGGGPTAPAPSHPSRPALHQFSGVVTALDKASLTVEKQGHAPRSMQFVRGSSMTTQGEIGARSRVTVYYRDVDGKSVAERVVVRSPGEHVS